MEISLKPLSRFRGPLLCSTHQPEPTSLPWRGMLLDSCKREQPVWRQRLQRAYNRPEYDGPSPPSSRSSMSWRIGTNPAGSLAEGLDETLTLHRLGVYGVLGRSLKTTNGLESINALIEERCEGRSLAELKSTPALARHGAPGHRAASTQGDGLPTWSVSETLEIEAPGSKP